MLISLAPIFESIVAWFENSDDINSFSGSSVYKQHNKNGSIKMFLTSIRLPHGHLWAIHPMLITAFLHFRPRVYWEPRNEVGSRRLTKRLVEFELGTFKFWL